MDPVAAVRVTPPATSTPATSTPATSTADKTTAATKDFASFLKDGESLKKITDHNGYEKIDGGKRDGEYLNVSGNKRNGQAFEIERVGHLEVHVYGKLRIVMGKVEAAGKKTTTAATTTAKTPVATTSTPTTTTGATGGVDAPDETADGS